jgi:hypothetical protein
MSLQVNLLKKSERRFQGIVSMKVMTLGSVGVLAGITALVFLLAGISKVTLNSNLDRARREFERVEPQAEFLRRARAATVANRKIMADIEIWGKGGSVPMHTILRAVQREIPAQIQLNELFAGLQNGFDDDKLYYMLRLNGLAGGELTAVETKHQLNANAEIRSFCGEVKLVSSQRESGEVWAVALDGRRLVGGDGK